MKVKIILVSTFIALSSVFFTLTEKEVKAACSDVYVDNDDPNYSTGDTGTWSLVNASTSQRGDHRIHYDSANVRYYWKPEQNCSSGYWSFSVYLNHKNFTNTSTRYYKNNSPTYRINQDTARAGWNTIETVYLGKGTTYRFEVSALAPSATQDTGADMIRFVD